MKELGTLFLVLAAQVTLPMLGGLWLSRRRDSAAACVPLVAATIAVLLLTPLAFAPRPEWKSRAPATVELLESKAAESIPPAAGPMGGIDLLQLLRLAKPAAAAEQPSQVDPWRILAIVGISVASFGLFRFLRMLIATVRIVRGSRPLSAPELQAVADDLALKLDTRRIALRESTQVGSAATAGWFRSLVLVSPDWRSWSAAERRAVLAHEIAHVARADFRSRLLARLAVALHGYHPLVRWLAARLELRQEMAADALAAESCGGRAGYVKCLAALALRADARPVGLVPTFASGPQTLLRRIAMLRVKDDTKRRARRWPAVSAVVLLAVAALGLRGTTPQALAGPIIPAGHAEAKDRPPLDTTYIILPDDSDEVGVFAMRVGEFSRMPGMAKTIEMYTDLLPTRPGDKKLNFTIADVEQLAGRVSLTHDDKSPPPNNSISLSLTSMRMAKDFDWPKQLQEWGTDWKEHTHAGTKYFSIKVTIPALGFKDKESWFYVPDARTLVVESEANIKLLIDAKKKARPTPSWADDWKAMEGGMFALVLPDVKGKLAKKMPEKLESDLAQSMMTPIKALCQKTARAAIGVDLADGFALRIRLACATADDVAAVDEGCQAIVKLAKASLKDDTDDDASSKAGKNFSSELLESLYFARGVEFERQPMHILELRMKSEKGVGELLKAFEPPAKGK